MSFSEQHSIPKDKLWIILLCEWKFDLVLFLQTQHLHYCTNCCRMVRDTQYSDDFLIILNSMLFIFYQPFVALYINVLLYSSGLREMKTHRTVGNLQILSMEKTIQRMWGVTSLRTGEYQTLHHQRQHQQPQKLHRTTAHYNNLTYTHRLPHRDIVPIQVGCACHSALLSICSLLFCPFRPPIFHISSFLLLQPLTFFSFPCSPQSSLPQFFSHCFVYHFFLQLLSYSHLFSWSIQYHIPLNLKKAKIWNYWPWFP